MGVLLETLRSVEFLRGADDDTVMRFMVLGRCVHQRKGHCFWLEGDPPRGVVVPVNGTLRSVSRSSEGREFIDRFAGPGECLGLSATITGLVHPTAAEVVRPGEFFTLRTDAFARFLKEYPEVRESMVRTMGLELLMQVREREEIALRSVPQRLARLLLGHSCVRQGDGSKVLLDATQGDLASRLGTVREVVARVLSRFAARELIARTRNGIFIEDWDGLRAIAEFEREPETGAAGTTPTLRTTRYFLPMAERGPRWEEDASGCIEHLGDVSECARLGCPNAANVVAQSRNASKAG
jgi:CRP/FNR family transcriptional regulator